MRRSETDDVAHTTNIYTYDADGRLTEDDVYLNGHVPGTDAPDRVYTYSYDLAGNRVRITDSGDGSGASDLTSSYDADDRLLKVSDTATATVVTSYTYDPAGNTLTVTSSDGTTTNTWDLQGRLVKVQTGGHTITYTYGTDGDRTSETADGVTTTDLNDPTDAYDRVLEEYSPGGARLTYVRGLDLLFEDDHDGATTTDSYDIHDGLGSTRALTDASGAVTDTYAYDPYGTLVTHTGSTPNDFLYAGLRLDDATGDYVTQSRIYDAAAGRFTSRDSNEGSTSDPITQNHYLYAGADPISNTDPGGHDFLVDLSISIGIGTAIGTIGGGASAAWGGASGSQILLGAARGALLGAAGGALGFLSYAGFAAVAETQLGFSTLATFWTATFASGATTGAVLSAGEAWWDTGDSEQILRQGLVGGLGGAVFAGIGGLIFRAAAPIWLRYVGRPKGLTPQQFDEFSQALRQNAGQYSDDIVVQGSRAAGIARNSSDIDVGLRVDPSEFDDLVRQSFGTPNPGSAKERTMLHAIETGKITAGDFAGRSTLRALRNSLEDMLGIEAQISVIKRGGPFDRWPNLPIR